MANLNMTATDQKYFVVTGRLLDSGDENDTLTLYANDFKTAVAEFVRMIEANYDTDEVAEARENYGESCIIVACIEIGQVFVTDDKREFAELMFHQHI